MSLTHSSTDRGSQPAPHVAQARLAAVADETPDAFRVSISRPDTDRCVLTVAGELDIATAPQLLAAVRDVIAEAPDLLVMDLDEVTFLDSTGLGVLISAHRRGGRLVLVCHNRACLRVLEITALSRVFTFAPTVEDALGM